MKESPRKVEESPMENSPGKVQVSLMDDDFSPVKLQQSLTDPDSYVVKDVTPARLTGIHFSILSDEEAERVSVAVVGSVNEVSGPALGFPSLTAAQCLTCGGYNSRDCEGHFGLINLPYTILHPYYMSEVSQILNKICPGCKSARHIEKGTAASDEPPRKCRYCSGGSKLGYPKMKFKVSTNDVFAKTAIIVEANVAAADNSSEESLASDYWEIIPKDPASERDDLPPTLRVLSPAQVYCMLKDVDSETLDSLLNRKNKIFLNSVLVTPNCLRVREFGQRLAIDETTRMYRKLIDFRGTANQLSACVIERYRVSKIRPEKVSSMQKEYEKQSTNESASSGSGLRNIKDLLLGKRTDNTFRMVVVGDPRIKVDEIGVPLRVAEEILILDHINDWNWEKLEPSCDSLLNRKGCFAVRRNGERVVIWSKDMLRTGDEILRPLTDGDAVLINRPPSIHQHSLIALRVKVLPVKYVVSINPLTCFPFRGDFDGDCLHGYVPQSIKAQVELSELVALDKQLINGQNGRNLMVLTQDTLTAAYLFVEDGVFLSKAEMQQLQMYTSYKPMLPAIVQPSSETPIWTGKQLFSLLLPQDFEYNCPSSGVRISGGELALSSRSFSWLHDSSENLFQCLIRHCGEKALDFLNAGQDLLCEWLMGMGLSVSLSDLYLSPDQDSRKNLLEDVSYALQKAEEFSDASLLMVDGNQDFLTGQFEDNEEMEEVWKETMSIARQTKAELFQASVSASKLILRDMQSLVYRCSSKKNSLIAMLNAGSKGNLQKLVQHSMCLGLQHSLSPLSFSVPRNLSCSSWNHQKSDSGVPRLAGSHRIPNSYIPCNIIANSFLSGLNPLECFVLSLTSRDGSFSGNADVAGMITRKLMFFMRDVIVGYDGIVKSNYGNQVVQFNYSTEDMATPYHDSRIAGHPVGAIAACAISEAAYSALDQPVSVLESSPLLSLKGVLECGSKKGSANKSASLFLSKSLGRWICGFEYGALEVKNHLECLVFSDIVSEIRICYSASKNNCNCPWVCHFHINKEVARKRQLTVTSIINSLYNNSKFPDERLIAANLPLRITRKKCSEADIRKKSDTTICITAELTESSISEEFSDLDCLQDMMIPILLQTTIKGFPEFKKVDILWKDDPNKPKIRHQTSGELYLRVVKSAKCDGDKFWSSLVDSCLRIRNLIDWERSRPDNIRSCSEEFGIDAGWQFFVNSLHSTVSETGKSILPEHLIVTANCLSMTGEFASLTPKGLANQRNQTNTFSPLSLACLSNPSDVIAKAAKMDQMDALQGSLEALSWGQTPLLGTGHSFDIVYGGTGHELSKSSDIYSLLRSHVESPDTNVAAKKATMPFISNNGPSQNISLVGIRKISDKLKRMLKKFPKNHFLKGDDKTTAEMALRFHPNSKEKIGTGIKDIKIGSHPKHKEKCFFVVRSDGTQEDFSYNKCINHALQTIDKDKEKGRKEKDVPVPVPEVGHG
ncbi:DNA-directed RNA polymerase IV subunit 1 isoform X2 [Andrographis paniculata]|nr:DNA-directed RNA polymerase IV subunit 1 isoform X2 [Andrographis paniculata]